VIESAMLLGKHALHRLEAMQAKYPLIHEVRWLGLQLGIELRRDGRSATEEADTVLYHSLSEGPSCKLDGGCVLTQCPPLTITKAELDQTLDIVEQGIKSVS